MTIIDPIYGRFEVKDSVLLELLNSSPLLRLKEINQHGASQYLFSWKKKTSRFDHSLGVMLLLRKFGASLEEQIAGLLHDVSHTAFSHVIDFVYPSDTHEFHEKYYQEIILRSEVPQILEKHKISLDKVLDEENFSLLESKLPNLCADRIDYFLRHMQDCGGDLIKVKRHVKNLRVFQKEFVFSNQEVALDFATDYLDQNERFWAHPREIACYQILAEAIKIGLKEKILSKKDLFTTDDEVMEKLQKSRNSKILKLIKLLNPELKIKLNKKNYDYHLKTKLRYVDPKVLVKGNFFRLSGLNPIFKKRLKGHNKKMKAGFYVKIVGF